MVIAAVAWGYADRVAPARLPEWQADLRGFALHRGPEVLAAIRERGGVAREDGRMVAMLRAFQTGPGAKFLG